MELLMRDTKLINSYVAKQAKDKNYFIDVKIPTTN